MFIAFQVPSTMPQQSGSGGPMFPYAYAFIGGNVPMPGSFQYGTPAIYQVMLIFESLFVSLY